MNILLAAIIFSFFAVFAPTSHGDRPLLHADPVNGEIAYSNFKLPIGYRPNFKTLTKSLVPNIVPVNLFVVEFFTEKFEQLLNNKYELRKNILSIWSSPFSFCEVLQV